MVIAGRHGGSGQTSLVKSLHQTEPESHSHGDVICYSYKEFHGMKVKMFEAPSFTEIDSSPTEMICARIADVVERSSDGNVDLFVYCINAKEALEDTDYDILCQLSQHFYNMWKNIIIALTCANQVSKERLDQAQSRLRKKLEEKAGSNVIILPVENESQHSEDWIELFWKTSLKQIKASDGPAIYHEGPGNSWL